MTHICFKMFF